MVVWVSEKEKIRKAKTSGKAEALYVYKAWTSPGGPAANLRSKIPYKPTTHSTQAIWNLILNIFCGKSAVKGTLSREGGG